MQADDDFAIRSTAPVSRRTVMAGLAWSLPAIAAATASPAFAGSNTAALAVSAGGCKLPGSSNAPYKDGYTFRLTVQNLSGAEVTFSIGQVFLNGKELYSPNVIRLSDCKNIGSAFSVPNRTSSADYAIIATGTTSEQGTLTVNYSVSSGTGTVQTTSSVAGVPPLQGEKCVEFTTAEKDCLSGDLT